MLVGDVVLVGDERNVSSLLLALRLDLTALPPSPLPAARTASIPNRREHLAQQRAVERLLVRMPRTRVAREELLAAWLACGR